MLRPVLIAALSARALAQSARRAGYEPIVLDAFGDEDTIAAAAHYERHSRAARDGFVDWRVKSFNAYWSRLEPKPALVLGAGFEHKPGLIRELAKKTRLAGCGWRAVQAVKNPETFFAALDKLGIAHPETRRDPPSNPEGWLKKQTGASGGAHIAACDPRDARDPGVSNPMYFQRRIAGAPVSLLGVAHEDRLDVVGFSRQWASPFPRRPFRYGGAVGPVELAASLSRRMIDAAEAVSRAFELLGLVSFDFLVCEGTPYVLEVNPRPSATLDLFDDENGGLFSAHMEACLEPKYDSSASECGKKITTNVLDSPPPNLPHKAGGTLSSERLISVPPSRVGELKKIQSYATNSTGPLPLVGRDRVGGIPTSEILPPSSHLTNSGHAIRAAAYLYADRGPLVFPKIDWPDWTADRPAPGARIPRGHPVATVFAEGAAPDEAEALCRKRLGLIEEMIYEPAQKRSVRNRC